MLPTLEVAGDFVLLDCRYRRGRNVQVGDVVGYYIPIHLEDWGVKRVLGMPGDYVVLHPDGSVPEKNNAMIQVHDLAPSSVLSADSQNSTAECVMLLTAKSSGARRALLARGRQSRRLKGQPLLWPSPPGIDQGQMRSKNTADAVGPMVRRWPQACRVMGY